MGRPEHREQVRALRVCVRAHGVGPPAGSTQSLAMMQGTSDCTETQGCVGKG